VVILDTTSAGVQKFRMIDPHIILSELYNYPITIITQGNLTDINNVTDDKLVCHASIAQSEDLTRIVSHLQKNGMKLIVDVDDYWELPTSHYLYAYAKTNKLTEKTINLIKKADLVTVTTKHLAKEILKYNNKTAIFPNSLDPKESQLTIKPTQSDMIRVGWTGGASHLEDMKIFRNLGMFTKIRGAQFVMAGFDIRIRDQEGKTEENFEKSVWKKYEEIITNNYTTISTEYKKYLFQLDRHLSYYNEQNEPYRRVWTKPANKYMKIFNEIDIVVVPLVDNIFNQFKSELKLIEAGFFKKPVVCSNVRQYADVIKHGESGFLVDEKRSHKDFTSYTRKLMQSGQMRVEFGERLYEHCYENFNLSTNSKKRLEAYQSL